MVFKGYAGSSFDIVSVEQNDDFANREYLSLSSVVYILVGKIYFYPDAKFRGPKETRISNGQFTWYFVENRDSRPRWAVQPGQKQDLVDDDLQYQEEENNSGFLLDSLVTQFPAIYIIIVWYQFSFQ